ncbi:MAG: hypothetical protein DI637_11100 [Citromicrobium sp.]|nr:MAG: hypothetical protein DI637_11100 [Citromicrobium sp.]
MSAGKPTDHPLTDILLHGGSEFADEVDQKVLELSEHPRFMDFRHEVADLLWTNSPLSLSQTENIEALNRKTLAGLAEIEARLRRG